MSVKTEEKLNTTFMRLIVEKDLSKSDWSIERAYDCLETLSEIAHRYDGEAEKLITKIVELMDEVDIRLDETLRTIQENLIVKIVSGRRD